MGNDTPCGWWELWVFADTSKGRGHSCTPAKGCGAVLVFHTCASPQHDSVFHKSGSLARFRNGRKFPSFYLLLLFLTESHTKDNSQPGCYFENSLTNLVKSAANCYLSSSILSRQSWFGVGKGVELQGSDHTCPILLEPIFLPILHIIGKAYLDLFTDIYLFRCSGIVKNVSFLTRIPTGGFQQQAACI